jgi:hypothetical protein
VFGSCGRQQPQLARAQQMCRQPIHLRVMHVAGGGGNLDCGAGLGRCE